MLKTGELANDVGTVLFGEEAVKNGLICEVGGLSAALSKLYELIDFKRKNKDEITKCALNVRNRSIPEIGLEYTDSPHGGTLQ